MSETARVALASPESVSTDLLVVGCFEDETPAVDGLPVSLAQPLQRLAARPGWSGCNHRTVESDAPNHEGVAAVALRGLGKKEDLDPFRLNRWLQSAVDAAISAGTQRLAVLLPGHESTRGSAAAERILRRLAAASYRFRRFLNEDNRHQLTALTMLPPAGEEEHYRAALATAQAVVEGMELCRELGNTPANVANPAWMEEQARALAEATGATLTVLGAEELEERGMNGILAVGGGSNSPPRLVRLDLGTQGPVVSLVGKGITFDSGGLSIKPSASMEDMKYDKCGACTVLGVVAAVAALELPIRLRVYLALAENMLDGESYRPGDILRCYNGKTVEIINTDAEGRIVLADTLAWAAEENPDWLVEFSTLTGACVIALGHVAAGLYTPSETLAGDLLAAAERTGERLWRLPYWPEFLEPMKSSHAELRNAGGRWGGSNTAAAFLGQFVGSCETWAHIDIAGPSAVSPKRKNGGDGATGYAVAFTVDWLRSLSQA